MDTARKDTEVVQQVADTLDHARSTGTPCEPIRDTLPEGDLDAAYAVQQANTDRRITAGERLVGRKIGLTSESVQRQLGVDQPDYGMLFASMAICDDEPIPAGALLQPRVEAEVAFVMEQDLDVAQPTVVDLQRSIAYALPVIEIVDSRIADWRISLIDTVADNASCGLFVLGNTPFSLYGLDLRDCRMNLADSAGTNVSSGGGHACLGHPLNATLWLARKMAALGWPLRAGDIVLSGALGPMTPVTRGEVYTAKISGLGTVRAGFSAA